MQHGLQGLRRGAVQGAGLWQELPPRPLREEEQRRVRPEELRLLEARLHQVPSPAAERAAPAGEPRPYTLTPVDNPYCSCKPTRVRLLLQCIRCPVAYHVPCIPAGCTSIGRNMICAEHHDAPKPTWNTDCCIVCRDGGELICCDTCIGSYHPACISEVEGFHEVPDGLWSCPNCVYGLQPSVGEVVWVQNRERNRKTLPLRPCQIVLDAEAPPSLGNPTPGQFLVKYLGPKTASLDDAWVLGKHEYDWQFHGCTITWASFDELGIGFTTGVVPGQPLYLGLQVVDHLVPPPPFAAETVPFSPFSCVFHCLHGEDTAFAWCAPPAFVAKTPPVPRGHSGGDEGVRGRAASGRRQVQADVPQDPIEHQHRYQPAHSKTRTDGPDHHLGLLLKMARITSDCLAGISPTKLRLDDSESECVCSPASGCGDSCLST